MGFEASESYKKLSKLEHERLRRTAVERNNENDLEKATIKERLRQYTGTGPLGSIDKHSIVDEKELYELLNVENSLLADLWKRDNVHTWPECHNRLTCIYPLI